jgi:anti-anti-sigma regulatory factor
MLRITEIETDAETVTFLLEGKIVDEWVAEIKKECEAAFNRRSKIILDLSRVNFVDEQGVETIRALIRTRVKLVGCSIFLSELINLKE